MIASTEATSSDESGRSREGPRALAFETTMEELAAYMRGWCGYFGFSETPEVLVALTRWVRWRPRAALGASGKQLSLYWAFKCILQIARPAVLVPMVLAQLLEPPCMDPHARWCGRGGTARLPPIPIAAPLCIGPSRRYWQAALKSPFEGRADVICWPRALRLVT